MSTSILNEIDSGVALNSDAAGWSIPWDGAKDPSIPYLPFEVASGGTQTLTQSSRHDNSNTFYTHVLTPVAVALTQSARHDNAATFYTHTLTAGAVALVQSSRFDNANGFYTHLLTPGAVALVQSARFDNANSFYTHLLTLAAPGTDICPSDLLTLTVAYQGQPFVHLQAYGIDTLELDTAYQGQPFIAQPYYESCEIIDPPEPEPEPDEVTIRPSGGHFTYPYDDQHRYSHLSKTVKRIIHEVAKEQVEENLEEVGTQESQAFVQQLITALAKVDLKYQAFYAEILEAERQRLIDEEIKLLMGIKRMRDEEEEVLAVLMAIP